MLIALHAFVSRGYSGESNSRDFDGGSIVDSNRKGRINRKPFRNEAAIRLRYHQLQAWVSRQDGSKSFSIEVIGVVVSRSCDINECEPSRINYQFRHPDVGLVGLTVLSGQ